MTVSLTRRQQAVYDFLRDHHEQFPYPPTLNELCTALGLRSRGSLHKHIRALVRAGLVEPMDGKQRGVRLVPQAEEGVPFYGYIAAGKPIEALPGEETLLVPESLKPKGASYVLQVRGDSMIDEGIFDGDYIVVEHREQARNGEIVVALVDEHEATLKRLEQRPEGVVLHPANSSMEPMHFAADRVQIQGVMVGLFRDYR